MRQKPSSADEEDVFFFANQKSSSIILLETKTFFKHLEKIRPIECDFFCPHFLLVVDKKCLLKKSFALFKKKFQVREEKASQLASEQIVLSGGTKGFTYAAAVAAKKVAR